MTELATGGAKVSTISRRLAAISFRHKEEKLPSPCSMKANRELAQVYAGIRKTRGIKQAGKAPVSLKLIKRMVDTVEGTLTAARDRALVLIGFAGGLRRSELAGIRFEHLQWHSSGSGITITLPKSKTDQERQGREVEIARGSQPENTPMSECTCPIRALEQWLRQANITSGPVFRKVSRGENVQKAALNPASVAWIVKRALGRAGVRDLDRYGAHSRRFRHHGLRQRSSGIQDPAADWAQNLAHAGEIHPVRTEGAPGSCFEPWTLNDVHMCTRNCSPQ
jgi:integrase